MNHGARFMVALLGVGLGGSVSARAGDLNSPGQLLDLGGMWLFHEGDNPAFAKPDLDDQGWSVYLLPFQRRAGGARWQGHGWYRRHFRVEEQALGHPLMAALGPAREWIQVFVNGRLVTGRGLFDNQPTARVRMMHLTGIVSPGLLHAGDNVLAVRVFDPSWAGGIAEGPLLLGPPGAVAHRVLPAGLNALNLRLALAMLAALLGLGQLLTVFGRRGNRENGWLVVGGLMLGVYVLDGTGLLAQLFDNIELEIRLPRVAAMAAILCLSSFFARRYDDWGARHVVIGQVVLAVLLALFLLLPERAIFVAGDAALVFAALTTTLYAANVTSRAARREERHALFIFASLVVLALLLVYDGVMVDESSLLPPWSVMGTVGVMLVTSVVGAYLLVHENENVLAELIKLRGRLEGQTVAGILDATALSITRPPAFLDTVMEEVARELDVRRCSLALRQENGDVVVSAAVGLPADALGEVVEVESISGWALKTGRSVSSTAIPVELENKLRHTGYLSASFIVQPILQGDRALGVLSVSDRNTGEAFLSVDEIAVSEMAQKLALVLTRLGAHGAQWSRSPSGLPEIPVSDLHPTVEATHFPGAQVTGPGIEVKADPKRDIGRREPTFYRRATQELALPEDAQDDVASDPDFADRPVPEDELSQAPAVPVPNLFDASELEQLIEEATGDLDKPAEEDEPTQVTGSGAVAAGLAEVGEKGSGPSSGVAPDSDEAGGPADEDEDKDKD